MLTAPWLILHGIEPAEYTCANELPFFSEKGSTVFIDVYLVDGKLVKPLLTLAASTIAALLSKYVQIVLTSIQISVAIESFSMVPTSFTLFNINTYL
jgi:hypothetical protein